ncbi:hypothetical protein BOX15_Mlig028647g3 [Macrostomum lignano]|uniref:UTP--glucose-1-phosphate uridylyltransferase n=1 Tax=Macrostomum lignano TaxID=282301 RepID=A0A267GES5_9PLAT|nr:hypothetical protein BOX15_Mlig028647g9 [Macrostomum lignano]PAA84543.1 hypothetical protein BOX15_Mlig028647g6 [Macrostomum lignano]PAA93252.1 hypothetical protein BOX15_Mlig028647g3 [Macrostomum lignano]
MSTPHTQPAFVPGHRRTPSQDSFKKLTQTDAESVMRRELQHLLETCDEADRPHMASQLDAFTEIFERYLKEAGSEIDWNRIQILDDKSILPYASLDKFDSLEMRSLLDTLVVIKLNGGLGTSMGCTGAKSLISVRSDLTFLDINIQQLEHFNKKYGCNVPLVLMNSFNTHAETEKVLRKYQHIQVPIHSFQQSQYPRVNRESLLPLPESLANDDKEAWYPPGHGDIYRSLARSGLLDQFLAMGKKWMFVANIDNLGATVDLNLVDFLEHPEKYNRPPCEFLMEVTEKTRADVKGGTLVEYDGKLRLLEIAQVPSQHVDEFTSVRKFNIFNTNNLWVSLAAVKRNVEQRNMHMEVIVNPKTLDNGARVLQLEEAVGAAIKNFNGAVGVNVPRSRFLPVKTCSDLLLVMSNLYTLHQGRLTLSHKRNFLTVPLVKLGTSFKKVKDFLSRFENIPDCLELDHLTVSGDVTFGKNVVLKGTVIIIANHGERIDIPAGAILENKIVSGNLRILDH